MSGVKAIKDKKRVALTSFLAAVAITSLKLVVGLMTNSLGILSEAAHSGLDMIAALITYFAVSVSDKPADRDHHYGHGKIENISAFVETMLLFATCGWIIWEAVHRLVVKSTEVDANLWGFLVIAVSIGVDISRSRALGRAAKAYNSQALEADALHFSSDIWSSLVVLVGLLFVKVGYLWVDAVSAIVVAVLVLVVSYRLGRRTIDALMDRIPEELYDRVFTAVTDIPGVERVSNIRIRHSGPRLFTDLTIQIPRIISFQQVHRIMDNVEAVVKSAISASDVIVHAEPVATDRETTADRIRMIVEEFGLPEPHDLRIRRVDGKYDIEFHVEFDRGGTFEQAHRLASAIESEIIAKLPIVSHVTIHLEEDIGIETTSSPQPHVDSPLQQRIEKFVLEQPRIQGCNDIRLFPEDGFFNLSFTCRFDRKLALGEVHRAVSRLENRLRRHFHELDRITIHTEPA